MTQPNNTILTEQTGLRTNSDSGTAVGQFDGRNRTVWNHYPTRDMGDGTNGTRAHVTDRSVRTKRSSINIIGDNSGAKNEIKLRTRKFRVSNNNTDYFGNVWKSLIGQDNIFSWAHNVRGRSGIRQKVLLHSDAGVNDTGEILVQKRGRRATEHENVDSGTTLTEENSVSEPALHSDADSLDAGGNTESEQCLAPEYIVYTWVLCLVALATALKLYYLVKTTLATAMVSVFTTLILVAYKEVFDKE
jgi:hypothetical protein